ncbi:pentapeptide repeat-containing protein [Neisseria elongata]|uniref:pentapeptide repeat-containing protein n=1 Tax=Neisseria elongata TaxID=495 RepID=UPI00069F5EE9|nr:pentapeptide repeat-containing protein [Neisseria elongata]
MENNNMEKIDQETLSVILKEHQLWLKSNGVKGKYANLSNKNLTEANLEGANLANADLGRANLRNADLGGANLGGANLGGANLANADLGNAYLKRTNLRDAYLKGAILRGADLGGADLRIADFKIADLRGANLIGADLRGADLRGADLRDADLEGANLEGANLAKANLNTQFFGSAGLFTDDLQRKLQSSEATIRELEEKLKQAQQAQSETVKNDEEITKLNAQLVLEKSEKQKITEKLEELNNLLNKRQEELRGRIKDAQKSLSEALKNTDKQIKNNEASASCFSRLGIGLFSLAIVLLIFFSMAVLFHPEYISEKKLNILFYTFPIITLMLIGTTCLRHQRNLLTEVRHFSNMKHQIELYSGLLEASQHAAVSFNNPEKANEYVQETFTQIRNRLLSSQYLPDNSSADKQSDNDFGSDKVLDLLNKIADLSGKKSMGN